MPKPAIKKTQTKRTPSKGPGFSVAPAPMRWKVTDCETGLVKYIFLDPADPLPGEHSQGGAPTLTLKQYRALLISQHNARVREHQAFPGYGTVTTAVMLGPWRLADLGKACRWHPKKLRDILYGRKKVSGEELMMLAKVLKRDPQLVLVYLTRARKRWVKEENLRRERLGIAPLLPPLVRWKRENPELAAKARKKFLAARARMAEQRKGRKLGPRSRPEDRA